MKNENCTKNQLYLFSTINNSKTPPLQLLKWIGNKQRYAHIITSYLPKNYNKYIEPFLGTGAILAAMNPSNGIAGDILRPLIDLMNILKKDSAILIHHYKKGPIKQRKQNSEYKILDIERGLIWGSLGQPLLLVRKITLQSKYLYLLMLSKGAGG